MPKAIEGQPDAQGYYYLPPADAGDHDGVADPPADVSHFLGREGR